MFNPLTLRSFTQLKQWFHNYLLSFVAVRLDRFHLSSVSRRYVRFQDTWPYQLSVVMVLVPSSFLNFLLDLQHCRLSPQISRNLRSGLQSGGLGCRHPWSSMTHLAVSWLLEFSAGHNVNINYGNLYRFVWIDHCNTSYQRQSHESVLNCPLLWYDYLPVSFIPSWVCSTVAYLLKFWETSEVGSNLVV